MAKEAAKLFSADEFKGFLETLDILSNKKKVLAIVKGSVEVRRGATLPLGKYIQSKNNRTQINTDNNRV